MIIDIPAAVQAAFSKAKGLLGSLPRDQIQNMLAQSDVACPDNTTHALQQNTKASPMRHLLGIPDPLVPTGVLYTDFFRFIDQTLQPRAYFEIGTHLGRSVKAFTCDAVCVDPHFMLDQDVLSGRRQTHFYQMPSDRFFVEHDLHDIFRTGPDVCFLDGMHRSEYLLRDFINTERKCRRQSIIFMHDCLPVNSRMARRTHVPGDPSEGHWQHAWTGDVWKVVPILQRYRPDLNLICLDCAPTGLIAATNLDPSSTVLSDNYGKILDELRTMDLETHTIRQLWENLRVLDTHSLTKNPEDLTLFIDIN